MAPTKNIAASVRQSLYNLAKKRGDDFQVRQSSPHRRRPNKRLRRSWQRWVAANAQVRKACDLLAVSTKFWATSGPHLHGNEG